MIKIENILNSPIINDPWPHKVVDDVFDHETFIQLKKIAKKINEIDDYDTPEIVWMNELLDLGIASNIIDLVINDADELMKNYNRLTEQFPFSLKSNLGWFNNPRLGVCPPNTINEIHDEGKNKSMAFIVYLDPEDSYGTFLYKTNEESSFVKEIEWKPNRAFLMYSTPGVSWHKFDSKDKPRFTLNFYYEKLEALEHLKSQSETEKILWLFSEFGKNKLIHAND